MDHTKEHKFCTIISENICIFRIFSFIKYFSNLNKTIINIFNIFSTLLCITFSQLPGCLAIPSLEIKYDLFGQKKILPLISAFGSVGVGGLYKTTVF